MRGKTSNEDALIADTAFLVSQIHNLTRLTSPIWIVAIRVGFVEMNPYDCGALGQSVNETRTLSYETTFDNAMS